MQSTETGALQKGRIFILGAGFSAAAGIPMTASLLERAMLLFRSECPAVFERVQNYAQIAFGLGNSEPDYKTISFSDLCTFLDYAELRESGGGERWCDHGSRERLVLKHYLGKAVINNTPHPDSVPELYRAFATQLRETDVVISFNWDCLFENALVAIGKPYTYGASDNRPVLCKMHGSVHWWQRLRTVGVVLDPSFSSISLATVTPSLVMSGEPNFLSSKTLRPLGPKVILTASASWFTPRRIAWGD